MYISDLYSNNMAKNCCIRTVRITNVQFKANKPITHKKFKCEIDFKYKGFIKSKEKSGLSEWLPTKEYFAVQKPSDMLYKYTHRRRIEKRTSKKSSLYSETAEELFFNL